MRVADASGGPETACLVRRQACAPRQGAWILRDVTDQQREMPVAHLVEAEKGALPSAAQPDSRPSERTAQREVQVRHLR